jgi:hypothetical protein
MGAALSSELPAPEAVTEAPPAPMTPSQRLAHVNAQIAQAEERRRELDGELTRGRVMLSRLKRAIQVRQRYAEG